MRIGLNTDSLGARPLVEALDLAGELGLDCVELATGNWSSAPHVDVDQLLSSAAARDRLLGLLRERGLGISALTCSGNQLAPGDAGAAHDAVTRRTIELAALLGVSRVILMSGLPAGPGDTHPNWVVVSWPPEAHTLLEWQWNEIALPYWHDLAAFTRNAGDIRLCVEPHAAQLVYSAATLLRLREAVGDTLGANLDPSHLFWMGADPLASVRALGDAIYHVHAKDARIERPAAVRTVLETIPLFDPDRAARAWNYVTLGDGHDAAFWRTFVTELRATDYDGVLSIEHEDAARTPEDGIRRSVELLGEIVSPANAGPVR